MMHYTQYWKQKTVSLPNPLFLPYTNKFYQIFFTMIVSLSILQRLFQNNPSLMIFRQLNPNY